MDNYGYNDWRSYLAHSLELRHSWGTKPEQKAREKEYNHEYWEKNKERIMAQRRKHKDKDWSGDYKVKYEESEGGDGKEYLNIADEENYLLDLIEKNAALGGYDNAAMENIRQHNENIIKNITALEEKINDYLGEHRDISDAQREQIMESFKSQVDKAMDFAIDLSKESSRGYLSDIGINPNGSSGKSSSRGRSESSSDDDDEKKRKKAGKKALRSQATAYETERFSAATSQKQARSDRALRSQARAYDERRR